MLTLFGRNQSFCGGVSRRSFLQVGALGCGLTLADLLRLRAAGNDVPKHKAVILIFLPGGPPHIDMYDMKPDAPAEVRGSFSPIHTNVPGMEISELMPMQAQIADKLAIVRSLRMLTSGHNDLEPLSGFIYKEPDTQFSVGKGPPRPSFGSIVSRLQGNATGLPGYVSLMGGRGGERPAYVGAAYRPFVPKGPDMENLTLSADVSLERLSDRQSLLRSVDNIRREADTRGEMTGVDAFTARALNIISSPQTRQAFDLKQESKSTREKYGAIEGRRNMVAEAEQFLLARRLVEAGVSVVTLSFGGWDLHSNLVDGLKRMVPVLDQALYGLITDLHDRGMDKDVTVLMWGEFGRGPRVYALNGASPGRDHHGPANFAFMAGGGLRMGQVVGATDERGERPATRPYSSQNVFATLYRTLGIDPSRTLPDTNGRPMYLLEQREPIAELI